MKLFSHEFYERSTNDHQLLLFAVTLHSSEIICPLSILSCNKPQVLILYNHLKKSNSQSASNNVRQYKQSWVSLLLEYFFAWNFFHRHWQFTGQQCRKGDQHYFCLPIRTTQENWDIYLQLTMHNDYHICLIALHVNYQSATWWDLPPLWTYI